MRVESSEGIAGGFGALASSLRFAQAGPGLARSLPTLARLNQETGFDCPGCAWPDPEHRSRAEFCENGVKHVAHETTRKRVDGRFFERWSLSQLATQSDQWLEAQGRIAEPCWRPAGRDHYQPISWEEACARIGAQLRGLSSPDEAVFYTSGRTANETAFLYQLLARQFGTNNLPDCSNMCHE
ncbi:MAG: hypothetical protein MJE66_16500, partial [Proteobacteria bacterium]|nr:hypothetical protein [Pseudomonadota bacterium]